MYRPGIPMNSNTLAQTDARVKPEHDDGEGRRANRFREV